MVEVWGTRSVGGRSGLEVSPFSGSFRRDGTTLDVRITRPGGGHAAWSLEVVAPDGRRRAWGGRDRPFRSDREAFSALLSALEAHGVAGVLARVPG